MKHTKFVFISVEMELVCVWNQGFNDTKSSFDERGVLLGHTVCGDVTTAIMLELVTLNL